MQEKALMTGKLEPTNEPYAIAKIAGIKLCESYNRQYQRDYRSVMPTNLYGPGDNYHYEHSHVVPALMRRFHEAKVGKLDKVVVWGTGKPMREFLYVDDMAEASLFLHNLSEVTYNKYTKPMQSHVNIGTGVDVTIKELAEVIKNVVGFTGKLLFDDSKPDGTIRKLMDVQLMSDFGWKSKTNLKAGLEQTYANFMLQQDNLRV